ncbi:MAG: S4 domain-containing protein [Rikenellaceae bacterium]
MAGVRLDKFLWSVRLFKTRSDAAEAIRNNKVMASGSYCKPSREVRVGEVISIKRPLVTLSYKVLAEVSNRQGAKLVDQYIVDVTPAEELAKLNIPKESIFVVRDRGTGRPTKRDRRQIDSLMDGFEEEEEIF